jgi:hypothetical protein
VGRRNRHSGLFAEILDLFDPQSEFQEALRVRLAPRPLDACGLLPHPELTIVVACGGHGVRIEVEESRPVGDRHPGPVQGLQSGIQTALLLAHQTVESRIEAFNSSSEPSSTDASATVRTRVHARMSRD